MFSLACKHCGQQNQVESLLTAAQKLCQHCGQPILGDRIVEHPEASRSSAKPWEDLTKAGDDIYAGSRSMWLNGVSYVNFVSGVLNLLCGLQTFLLSNLATSVAASKASARGATTEQIKEAGTLLNILAIAMIVSALLMFAAGVGLRYRLRWGRYLTLGIASLAALACVDNVINVQIGAMLRNGLYALACFYILFRPDVIREFHQAKAPHQRGQNQIGAES
jgi:hypothetical protein